MESTEELKALKQENSKLKLEARLRKSLASELERQKSLVQEAKVDNLVKDVTKSFYRITSDNLEQETLINGLRESLSERNGPVWFEVPIDSQSKTSTYAKTSIKPIRIIITEAALTNHLVMGSNSI